MKHDIPSKVNLPLEPLLQARLHNPFSCLGVQRDERGYVVRVFNPYAQRIWLQTEEGTEPFERVSPEGLHEWHGDAPPPKPYRLQSEEDGISRNYYDPYAFPLQISEHDLYLFNEGKLYQAYHMLGSHQVMAQGVTGIRFAVWAPNAERVSVVGDFNHWDGRVHPMAVHGASGVWELFIPGLQTGVLYKYEIRHRGSGSIHIKTDPYAQAYEVRPGTASRTAMSTSYQWSDSAWMAKRSQWNWLHQPLNIYELHVGSWKRHPDGRVYSYRDLIQYLIPYVLEMGYTHIELLPVSEHPLDESWGYQTTGYFAATSRYGSPDDLRAFIDACHNAGIGVFLDWVPAHFPQDSFALARFDGTALYEHEDPRLGYHHDWGTHIFNYGRNEVKSFLLSSAYYWLSEFHIDGIRVDAVASMLYLDYSRKSGEWLPNKFGGRENLDAIEFLRNLNIMVHESFPGALTMAEESTAWPSVSRPVYLGGLGFSMKWNMGWMNDTLSYMQRDPIHRRYHHNQLTFGQIYAYSENFVLPLSHDEVVHGKQSLLGKMPGDGWQKFANVRLLLSYQMTTPGKKLNFMGNELAQGIEWRVQSELEWWQLGHAWHQGVQAMVRDLNRWYRDLPALHELDFSHDGFAWIDCNDADQSVLVYQRRASDGSFVVVALNFTPVPRWDYCIGVPQPGCYREIFNSDSHYYGGSNLGNGNDMHTTPTECMGQSQSLNIVLPPLAAVMIIHV